MTNRATVEELLTKVNLAFQEGDYPTVIEITSQHANDYPEQKPVLVYMQICAYARLGQKEQVCEVLEGAIKQGTWFSERALRESPSLQPLTGLPEYERLIQLSSQAAATEKVSGEKLIVVEPDTNETPYPLLFALHSNGSSAREARNHWSSLVEDGWMLVLPQAPTALWKGTYNWEDAAGDLEITTDLFTKISLSFPVDSAKTIVGGHSMGGKLAIELVLSGKIPAQGFLAVAPYISEEDLETWKDLIEKNKQDKFKGVILFGENDETIPQKHIYTLAELLEEQGKEVLVQHFQGIGHEFGIPIRQALGRAIDFILS